MTCNKCNVGMRTSVVRWKKFDAIIQSYCHPCGHVSYVAKIKNFFKGL